MYVEKDNRFRLIIQDITFAEASQLCHEYEELEKVIPGKSSTVLGKIVSQIKKIMPWVIKNAE